MLSIDCIIEGNWLVDTQSGSVTGGHLGKYYVGRGHTRSVTGIAMVNVQYIQEVAWSGEEDKGEKENLKF